MAKNTNTDNHKRIFILGAGSSIGNSKGLFPSVYQFFTTARELKLWSSEKYRNLNEYGRSIYGKNIFASNVKTDIEDFFTFIEIEIEKNPSHELFKIRQQLLDIIQQVLTKLCTNNANKNGEYANFASEIKSNDTIITFNWDISLDHYLHRDYVLKGFLPKNKIEDDKIQYYQYYNFILDYSALGEHTWKKIGIDQPYQQWDISKGYYLKAHGSVDWYYCQNESCRAFRKVFPVIEPTKDYSCSECHEQLDCLIIPPILNKGYRQYPLIRRIWNLATQEINSCTDLIIWGYSLPPTDFYCSWLIRQARQAPIKNLILINPEVITKRASKIQFGRSFVGKFTSIFNGIDINVSLFENFNDYLANLDIKEKYDVGES